MTTSDGPGELDAAEFADLVTAATARITGFVAAAGGRPIQARHSAQEITDQLRAYTFEEPLEPATVLADSMDMLERWNLDTTHPRHFGWFNPSPHLAAVLAELLTAAYNPQLAVWDTSPIGTELELHLLRYLGTRLGYQREEAAGCFTSGGAEANLTAIVLALTHAIPGYGELGLAACDGQPLCYVSAEFHRTLEKGAVIAGLGRQAVRVVPVSADGVLDIAALASRIESDRAAGGRPVLVVANAGSTNLGALDPLPAVADLCAETGIWFHVDAAWGGAAALSDKRRQLLDGAGRADSITLDPHKWLAMPLGIGASLTRHGDLLRTAFRIDAPYAAPRAVHDFYTSSIQWSRRFCGLALFLALAIDGRAATAARLDHQADMADYLRTRLRDEGWTLDNSSPFPVVCFHDDACQGASQRIADDVNDGGQAWISGTSLPSGLPALRACITSFRTRAADIDTLLSELRRARASALADPDPAKVRS